jgi:broad specificity phosphatase PhoE
VKFIFRYYILIITGWLISFNSQAQKEFYEEIIRFYDGFEKSDNSYNPPLKFINKNDLHLDNNLEVIQIMLIRHGDPIIDTKGWFYFYEASNFVDAYDTVGVYYVDHAPVSIQPGEILHVYCSPLQRAKSTAEQLFGDQFDIIYDSSFVEFKNEIIPLPWIRLPLKFWRVSSRLVWMAGLHSSQVPSLSQQKDRSREVAARLGQLANKEKRVVLVAHGLLNRYIIRYLKKDGWQHSFDGGYGYLNVQVLSKICKK